MDSLSNTAVLLIGHGSRRETYNEDIENLISYIEKRINLPIYLTYNEFAKPDWRELLRNIVNKGFERIVIGLVFLGRGNHVFKDIMEFIKVNRLNNWVKTNIYGKEVYIYVTEPLASSPLVTLSLYYRLARALKLFPDITNVVEDPLEIEENSMNMILSSLDTKDEKERRIVAKAIFASGNPEIAKFIRINNLDAGIEAIRAESEIVTDVKMVAAGIRWKKITCMIDDDKVKDLSKKLGITRAAASMRIALKEGGKVVVIGNAPTALIETLKIVKEGIDIPFIVASPPGFTNAKDSKEALVKSSIPSVVVTGTYGGSGVAVAIINEIIRLALEG
ncbi:MAG: precorrin-8X methylmutase [Saccharolobus sp.]|uniref:precorrin-8X methylmutase n=1 Tax=Saccharolobus sp. TaxID=2100761 RepID=UPI0028CF1E2D|nr:precorrin-8X methylmutase [Saccharolobus sp.]MDT7862354.1 precorrin-8X methylmutase [Saccharolobus sp.]